MSAKHKTPLQWMDTLVWWSGASRQVRQDMSNHADGRRHQPMRWLPLLPMAAGAGLVSCATAFAMPSMMYGVAAMLMPPAAAIALQGPLGKSSIDDDEREAALRRDAFFFCMALLALVNIVAGPVLLLSAALKGWTLEQIAGVAYALFMANMAWFVSLPTLYASWKSPSLSDDES